MTIEEYLSCSKMRQWKVYLECVCGKEIFCSKMRQRKVYLAGVVVLKVYLAGGVGSVFGRWWWKEDFLYWFCG